MPLKYPKTYDGKSLQSNKIRAPAFKLEFLCKFRALWNLLVYNR